VVEVFAAHGIEFADPKRSYMLGYVVDFRRTFLLGASDLRFWVELDADGRVQSLIVQEISPPSL
jgi:hypothetical protein